MTINFIKIGGWITLMWIKPVGIRVFILMQFWFTCQAGRYAGLWWSVIDARPHTTTVHVAIIVGGGKSL